jgi:hypothetical protein
MAAVTKNRIFFQLSIAALVQVKMSSNFNYSYMARSSLAYVMPNLHNPYISAERKPGIYVKLPLAM